MEVVHKLGDEIIYEGAVAIPLNPSLMSKQVLKKIQKKRFFRQELKLLETKLSREQKVLLLSSGYGFLSSHLAQKHPHSLIEVVEPDEAHHDQCEAAHTHSTSKGIRLSTLDFTRSDTAIKQVNNTLSQPQSSFTLYIDLNVTGLEILDDLDLSQVENLLLRTTPPQKDRDLYNALLKLKLACYKFGLELWPDATDEQLVFLTRGDVAALPLQQPNIFVATCMKNEGPFILEWVAWHKALGVTDITVFTNDCSDGTDRLLDRLAELGHVNHLPNPTFLTEMNSFQPIALRYAAQLREMRKADYFISMDVDEFINVQIGDCNLPSLIAAAHPFDVLSISEVNHGANKNDKYQEGWITELFPSHETTSPGRHKSRRGVKSIVRLSDRVIKLRNHRPDMSEDQGELRWLNGSGHPTRHFIENNSENGHDSRHTYDWVRLDHFPLRSLESYLTKLDRGDVVAPTRPIGNHYWRLRNRDYECSTNWGPQLERAKAWYETHFASDALLMQRHAECCQAHRAKIEDLLNDPTFQERKNWIFREAWDAEFSSDDEQDTPNPNKVGTVAH